MKIQLYFLRHGQTTHSRDERFCGCGTDAQLTDDGFEMARCFGRAYSVVPWAGIYCSPQTRARRTVEPLSAMVNAQPQIRDGLKEIDYGDWEDKSLDEVRKIWGSGYDIWASDPLRNFPPNGETAQQIATRALAVIDEIKASCAENCNGGNFLIVSHKATIRITLCALLGIDLALFRQRLACPVASVSRIELSSSGAMLKCLGDVSHLDARLRELPGS